MSLAVLYSRLDNTPTEEHVAHELHGERLATIAKLHYTVHGSKII